MANGTMMQFFHWYLPSGGQLWNEAATKAKDLAELGVTALWFPPAYKGTGPDDVGYGPYDLYDLGEFDQKGTFATKYGTKAEYLNAIEEAHKYGIQVYADVVLNHKAGADACEWVRAICVPKWNRLAPDPSSLDDYWIQAWTVFNYPVRGGKYSDFKWDWTCFDGVDFDNNCPGRTETIYKFQGRGKDWASMVSGENGNYDYLMFSDIDMNDPAVRTELGKWGEWYLDETGVDGFRLDAVKHIQYSFFRYWLSQMRRKKPDLFAVGEYWNPDHLDDLQNYIDKTQGCMSLFDAPLHRYFFLASRSAFDMRRILDGSLVSANPVLAVTLVDNHDTQPCQSLESWVDYWFKPLAYSLILLREAGYPCVFYPDLYGATYSDKGNAITLVPVKGLEVLLRARKELAYGFQRDYFDHPNVIGWTREGSSGFPLSGLAVVMSNSDAGWKRMDVGLKHAGEEWVDVLGNLPGSVIIDASGKAEFRCAPKSVSVWASKDWK